ncbi:PqqD family peptide modification chaperone [Emticicia sp. CRIBPO]|uniref:PqqD family protein n=1 Tax=Emticicia sp. CRIBPO TaxID=2683258 RepID=UPI0014132320|nr:PqqD family protein [Emticicia sp. CRIBPO]NBA89148.1 PqqD family peptide modification chaperone [Emticicia sp. CRIBPO]
MSQYRLSQNHVSSNLEGESVILDHQAGTYFGLNSTGTVIWELLQKAPADFETLKNEILSKYAIDEQTCSADLKNILTELINEKLIEEV